MIQDGRCLKLQLVVLLLLIQIWNVSCSRDLLLNAPSSKDSLFLSQPSKDWGPGGKFAEQARKKHNARAAFLRGVVASVSNSNSNSNHNSNQIQSSWNPNNKNQVENSGTSGSGSGTGLDDRIRAGMRLHLDQNGLVSNSTNTQQQRESSFESSDLTGKSEDRLVTSGQKEKAEKDANRISQDPNQEGETDKKQESQIESNSTPPPPNAQQNDQDQHLNKENPKDQQNQNSETLKIEDGTRNQNQNGNGKQRPPAEIISNHLKESNSDGILNQDETWERSNLQVFSNSNQKSSSKGGGRSSRRYPIKSNSKSGLIDSLKDLSTSFEKDSSNPTSFKSDIKSESKLNSNSNERKEKFNNNDNLEELKEIERLNRKNRDEALKQAEEAARNAIEDPKVFRDSVGEDQLLPKN